MIRSLRLLWILPLLVVLTPPARSEDTATRYESGPLLYQNDFSDPAQWLVEQRPGGTVRFEDGKLTIEDVGGCTVWYRQELKAPVIITYEATVVDHGGPDDRVSDLNCFWMATDPSVADGSVLATTERRTGAFADYNSLRLYYGGCGGNNNTTTRFRRYTGLGDRPLLPDYDLRDKKDLLQANHTYHIMLVAVGGRAQYYRDGRCIFDYPDPDPLTKGWFGFRTVHSHIVIRHFRVWSARPVPAASDKG